MYRLDCVFVEPNRQNQKPNTKGEKVKHGLRGYSPEQQLGRQTHHSERGPV